MRALNYNIIIIKKLLGGTRSTVLLVVLIYYYYCRTYVALFSCGADADIEKLTSLKLWGRSVRSIGYICTSDVSNDSLALHLTNVKPLGIIISHILSLSTTVHTCVHKNTL